jgi:hypothetical protein
MTILSTWMIARRQQPARTATARPAKTGAAEWKKPTDVMTRLERLDEKHDQG